MDTTILHSNGHQTEIVPSEIPENATIGDLFKLLIFGSDKSVNFFGLYLEDNQMDQIRGHLQGLASTYPLPKYNVQPIAGNDQDKRRVRSIQTLVNSASFVQGSNEAIKLGDKQRAVALNSMAWLLMGREATLRDAERTQANTGNSAMLNLVQGSQSSINQYSQGPMLQAAKLEAVTNLILARAHGQSGQAGSSFFRAGGADSAALLSAPQDPFATGSTVLPYDPTTAAAALAATLTAPIVQQQPQQPAPVQPPPADNPPPNNPGRQQQYRPRYNQGNPNNQGNNNS
jgi:hypothetical protein